MLETLRKYVEAGLGALPTDRAEALAKKLVEQGQTGKEQAGKVARDMIEWSRKNGERITKMVRAEVRKQILALGVATKSEVEALKKRVAALEGKQGSSARSSATRGSTSKKSTTAKKTTTRKPTSGS